MNYRKLEISFLCLLVMTLLQFIVSAFVVQNHIITFLSIIAIGLCILGLWYVNKQKRE
ncbi:MAG: hypothetical protein ACRCW2_05995 [Cellulosilyticaceae bacterium]